MRGVLIVYGTCSAVVGQFYVNDCPGFTYRRIVGIPLTERSLAI